MEIIFYLKIKFFIICNKIFLNEKIHFPNRDKIIKLKILHLIKILTKVKSNISELN